MRSAGLRLENDTRHAGFTDRRHDKDVESSHHAVNVVLPTEKLDGQTFRSSSNLRVIASRRRIVEEYIAGDQESAVG